MWLVVQVLCSFPVEITDDWMGWRQADTQSIAENFISGDGRILYPQINWGGDGPGYVETEFQLYTYLISLNMRLVGTSERPGLYLSLLAMATAGLILWRVMRSRFGGTTALFGLAVFLGMRGPVFLSSTVQPDALSFMFYCLSFATLLAYLDQPKRRFLVPLAAATILATLVKATALHIGIFQFLAVLLCAPHLLRRPGLWLTWLGTLAVVSLYLWHGNQLYQLYGNTFGVIGDGDSKFATMRTLLQPGLYPSLMRLAVVWGLGALGSTALIILLLTKRLDRIAVALGTANLIYLLVAFRYTRNEWNGPHYHLFSTVLGVWMAASLFKMIRVRFTSPMAHRVLIFSAVVLCTALTLGQLGWRHDSKLVLDEKDPVIATGKALREICPPHTLVIVRSSATAHDTRFGTENNFEDPRIFYLATVRGWVIPADDTGPASIQAAALRGAQFYVEPFNARNDAELNRWLLANTEKIIDLGTSGRIFRLILQP